MSRVMVVEDDAALRKALTINLRARGYDVLAVASGTDALRVGAAEPLDLVVLDLGLPDIDGIEVLEGLRGWNDVPVIVLSARETQADKVMALDAGADDYVTKPFGMDELLARMRASLRRSPTSASLPTLVTEDFTIDFAAKHVVRGSRPVRLTPTEWHLLEILAHHRGALVTQRELLAQVWGPAYEKETNYLRVYLAQLRRKLEPDPSSPRYLITEAGIGYRFEG